MLNAYTDIHGKMMHARWQPRSIKQVYHIHNTVGQEKQVTKEALSTITGHWYTLEAPTNKSTRNVSQYHDQPKNQTSSGTDTRDEYAPRLSPNTSNSKIFRWLYEGTNRSQRLFVQYWTERITCIVSGTFICV